ncbi:MAG TPA: type III-B CRISPR-associated protein Cas10/Cmr2 [Ktedonobacteraceae bacterium]|nr:type III-B CRISPR-associated protein Cas10/Cmr2 [Ktedonobacteraceae bacterium]
MTTQAMLMYSLGSVQSFITQARKTRDLWLGSYLYSALMEAAMEGMPVIDPTHKNAEGIVFPATTGLIRRVKDDKYHDDESYKKNIPELPNKYVAIYSNPTRAKDAAQASTRRIEDRWGKIRDAVWQNVIVRAMAPHQHASSENFDLTHVKAIWDRQTSKFETSFEIFWVVVEQNNLSYPEWLEHTEHTLNGRKLLRNFVSQQERGEKSTISGEREALSRSESGNVAHSRQETRTFWREFSQRLVDSHRVSPLDISTDGSERLDAIDTIKRFAMLSETPSAKRDERIIPEQSFPTVSSIATAAFVRDLLIQLQGPDTNQKLIPALVDWLAATTAPLNKVNEKAIPYLYKLALDTKQDSHFNPVIDILKRDGDCFMPETFRFQRLQKDYDIKDIDEAKRRAAQGDEALKDLLKITDEIGLRRPRPYFAILQMDGDGMGKIMRAVSNESQHQGISSTMADFARNHVPLIVERDFFGRLVYAGGDDVLAFSTLRNLLALGDTLQQRYCEIMKAELDKHPSGNNKAKPAVSASMGIVIAHTYSPLSYVLRSARDAEHNAKSQYGRNALVVSILRRSGQQTRVGCKWHYDDLHKDAQPMKLFQKFAKLFEDDLLSPKCIHLLLDESPSLIKMRPEAQVSEIKRIFKRQSNPALEHKQRVAELDQDAQHLVDLAKAMKDTTCRELYFNDHPEIEDKGQKLSDAELDPYRQRLALDLHDNKHRRGLVEALGWLLVMEFLDRKRELN